MSGVIGYANITMKLEAELRSSLDLRTPIDPLSVTEYVAFANGTATGQVSQMWSDTRTLTASATEDIDFAASITNAFGVSLTFVKIKCVFVRAATTNTNNVQVTRKATTGFPVFMADGDGVELGPGESFMYLSPTIGKTVTATTDDTLTFTNSAGGTSVVYDVVIIGTD